MSTKGPIHITSNNLSLAWANGFLAALETPSGKIAPMTICISDFSGMPPEEPRIRSAVDNALAQYSRETVRVSAFTIFPEEYRASLGDPDSNTLASGYLKDILPRMRAQNSKNAYGTYFERMVAFRGSVRRKNGDEHRLTNQLDHIVQEWRKRKAQGSSPRHSALVVSCFDPAKDHTGQSLRGFPCLTQVTFGYDRDGGLALTAFYPTQYLFDRAYGNYLGLANLGNFVARQMGLTLKQLNFFIGRPETGSVSKENLMNLAKEIRSALGLDQEERIR